MEGCSINSNSELARKLDSYLQLDRRPVGVKFLQDDEDFDLASSPQLKGRNPYCVMVRNAARGECVKADLYNSSCLSAAKAVGLCETEPNEFSGKKQYKAGQYDNLAVSSKTRREMVYCDHRIKGVELRPLEAWDDSDPDVIIIVTSPYNAMRIAQGYSYYFTQVKSIKLTGLQAICQECTSYPFEKNDINFSMLCSGTRMLCKWEDDELAVGMPYHYLEPVIEGIKNTINPYERNKKKREIQARMDVNQIAEPEIIYNKNYDDGSYKGLPRE